MALMAALLLSVPTRAQVFIMDESIETGRVRGSGDFLPDPDAPGEGQGNDWGGNGNGETPPYAPLGGGMLILGCLGGAYLLGRRRKEGE